jgi:hypothetical protein
LNHKERLLHAFRHEPVDRLPTQINYTAGMGAKMAAHFGIEMDDLPAFLDNHLLRVDLSFEQQRSQDGQTRFDWWGAGHDTGEEGYYIRVNPLANSRDLEAYACPIPTPRGFLSKPGKSSKPTGQNISSSPTWVSPCLSAPGRCAGWSSS